MSTTYAVKMRRSMFVAQAHLIGWQLESSIQNVNGDISCRLYLHHGSEDGYAFDVEEERGLDGEWWTLFTRYGNATVSSLVSYFGAMDEHHHDWWDVFCDGEQQALREVREGAAAYFDYWIQFGNPEPPRADELTTVIEDEFRKAQERSVRTN